MPFDLGMKIDLSAFECKTRSTYPDKSNVWSAWWGNPSSRAEHFSTVDLIFLHRTCSRIYFIINVTCDCSSKRGESAKLDGLSAELFHLQSLLACYFHSYGNLRTPKPSPLLRFQRRAPFFIVTIERVSAGRRKDNS